MGLTLTSDDRGVKVIRQDKTSSTGNPYTQYSIMTSTKDGDEWINGFIDVAFPKGTDIPNKSIIKINEAFPLTSKYKDKTYVKWFIKDYAIIQSNNAPTGQPVQATMGDFINVPEGIESDLPFARPTR